MTTSVTPPTPSTPPIDQQDPCDQMGNPESYQYVGCDGNYRCVQANAQGMGFRQCLPGWKGKACREPTEFRPTECPNPARPCENGGFCLSSQCCCPAGWRGMFCDVQAGPPCASDPCQYGGTCNPAPNTFLGYTCTCPPGMSQTL